MLPRFSFWLSLYRCMAKEICASSSKNWLKFRILCAKKALLASIWTGTKYNIAVSVVRHTVSQCCQPAREKLAP